MLATNTLLAHYRILSRLGAGGMGEVYLAEDTNLGRKVALKILSSSFTRHEDRLRRFAQEARAASALNHPNILTIYEIGQAGDMPYIATEYVEGVTLSKLIAQGRFSLRQALDAATQLAGALAAAHAAGIVHRDIKPANIMLRPDGLVKVLDFGLAKLTESPAAQSPGPESETATAAVDTEDGRIVGTPQYMSPEQARGIKVDARTDIFSLGVVLYEMVAGKRPFDGDTSSHAMVAILEQQPLPLARYLPETPEELQRIVNKALKKDPEERYQVVKDLQIDLRQLKQQLEFSSADENRAVAAAPAPPISPGRGVFGRRRKLWALALSAVIVAAGAIFLYLRRAPALTPKDTILLTDFVNTTGDAAFDDTLKQGLAATLEQSPYLNVLADERVRETLKYMGRSPDERVTRDIGRDICRRDGVKALIEESISPLGGHYVLTLTAMNAVNGDTIARLQAEAESKERVLHTLGGAASQLRHKLGESLASIQRFDAPVDQATTSSLEALQDFIVARQKNYAGDYREAARYAERAIELDPNFAMAQRALAVYYLSQGERHLLIEPISKAFVLRDRVSERERLIIEETYYYMVTGEIDRAIESMETATRLYPQYQLAWHELGQLYTRAGQPEKAQAPLREAIRLLPNVVSYFVLAGSFLSLNRLPEARETCSQAAAHHVDSPNCHFILYQVALLNRDSAEIEQQLEWAAKHAIPQGIAWQRRAASVQGRLGRARELGQRSLEAALRNNAKDQAGNTAADMAADDAILGQCRLAVEDGQKALELARSDFVLWKTGLAFALCGEDNRTQSAIEELTRLYPKDIRITGVLIPSYRGLIDARHDRPATPGLAMYSQGLVPPLAPVFCRGQVFLLQHKGAEAAAEFQTILDKRGEAGFSTPYPAAYAGLARAAALTGDFAKSRKAYEELFALWKDADSDLPLLVDARREYEKLPKEN